MEDEAAAATEEAAGARKRKRGGDSVEDGAAEEAEEEQEEEGGGYEKGLLLTEEKGLLLAEDEEEEGCYEGIEEAAVVEVMRCLEAEISDDYYLAPAPAPPGTKEEEALGFVTINGNEESCGPSFSCAASTVMASVDTRPGAPPPPPVPWPWPFPEVPSTPAAEEKVEADEEAWLAELLACGPLLDGFSL